MHIKTPITHNLQQSSDCSIPINKFNETIKIILNSLAHEHNYAEKSLISFKTCYLDLKKFIELRNFEIISAERIKEFKKEELSAIPLSRYRNGLINTGCNVLIHFLKTKEVKSARYLNKEEKQTYRSCIKESIVSFISYLKDVRGLRDSTINKYESDLLKLDKYLFTTNTINLKTEILDDLIINLSGTLHFKNSFTKILKSLLSYMYEEKQIDKDYSKSIINIRYVQGKKLPSYLTATEIDLILKTSKNRFGQRASKRNYAILLLLVKYGIRSVDIVNLQFNNINWKENRIQFIQAKTLKEASFPLLPMVGNAIIDYLKNERPSSKIKYIFLRSSPPKNRISNSNAVSKIAIRAIKNAGIEISNRKIGSHSFRHSLAKELLDHKYPVNIISEVLSHSNIYTVKNYLRIDTKSLRNCSLEIIKVDDKFYNQKNGKFFRK